MAELLTRYAVYVADEAGPVDGDNGVCATCVAVFGDVEDAIKEAAANVREGHSVSIDIGMMTDDEWDALEEVPDDFRFTPAPALDDTGHRSQQRSEVNARSSLG